MKLLLFEPCWSKCLDALSPGNASHTQICFLLIFVNTLYTKMSVLSLWPLLEIVLRVLDSDFNSMNWLCKHVLYHEMSQALNVSQHRHVYFCQFDNGMDHFTCDGSNNERMFRSCEKIDKVTENEFISQTFIRDFQQIHRELYWLLYQHNAIYLNNKWTVLRFELLWNAFHLRTEPKRTSKTANKNSTVAGDYVTNSSWTNEKVTVFTNSW